MYFPTSPRMMPASPASTSFMASGAIELLGASRKPLLRPTIAGISLSDLRWDYLADWIPQARGSVSLGCGSRCDVTLTICAPVGERGS